ncbi:MAG: hypothetical protein ACREM3_14420 [Candidatus Rokuibacteriota bacterium]
MDYNDYVALEGAARDRLDDLRRVTLFKHDSPRTIDGVIDYFGDPGRRATERRDAAVRARARRPACVLRALNLARRT